MDMLGLVAKVATVTKILAMEVLFPVNALRRKRTQEHIQQATATSGPQQSRPAKRRRLVVTHSGCHTKTENSTCQPVKQEASPIERDASVEPVSQGQQHHNYPQQHTLQRHNPSSQLAGSFRMSLASISFNILQKMADVLVEEPPDNEVPTHNAVARDSSSASIDTSNRSSVEFPHTLKAFTGPSTSATLTGGSIDGVAIGGTIKAAAGFNTATFDPNVARGSIVFSNTAGQTSGELVKVAHV